MQAEAAVRNPSLFATTPAITRVWSPGVGAQQVPDPTPQHRFRPGRHDENPQQACGHTPTPAVPDHAVAGLGVGARGPWPCNRRGCGGAAPSRLAGASGAGPVLEHGLDGVVPRGELSAPFRPPGVGVSRRASLVERGFCRPSSVGAGVVAQGMSFRPWATDE